VLRTGNTVSTDSVTAPWSLGSRSERTWKVRERQMNPNSDLGGAVERRERDAVALGCERIYGEVHPSNGVGS